MGSYFDKTTERGAKSTTEFDKRFFKNLNYKFSVKLMENSRKR